MRRDIHSFDAGRTCSVRGSLHFEAQPVPHQRGAIIAVAPKATFRHSTLQIFVRTASFRHFAFISRSFHGCVDCSDYIRSIDLRLAMDFLQGETCERCSAIPWEEWYRSIHSKVELTESAEQLQSSPCPICRVIGLGMVDFDRPESSRRPITRLAGSGHFMRVGYGNVSWHSNLRLYHKDDEDFVQFCRVHPKRVDFAHAKRWIRACLSTHGECKASLGSALHDLKVLDCYDRIVVSAPEHCEYVALSYVWGKAGLEDAPDLSRIPDILPRTVEDSIKATIMLGYRYLWIDRYVCLLMKILRIIADGTVRRST